MIPEEAIRILREAELSRSKLEKRDVELLSIKVGVLPGDYLRNFAKCVLNREIDIFDDSQLLLKAGRMQAACTVSRAMIETYAFSRYLLSKVEKSLEGNIDRSSLDNTISLILKFTNSSRHKVNEQEKLKKGVFSASNYKFTDQALERMEMGLAASEHVMNALRELYKQQKEQMKMDESGFELIYDALSEWVHPSQTSIFHHYVKETQMIPSSMGTTNLFDFARLQCAMALHFITDAMNKYEYAMELAETMDTQHQAFQ